MPKKKLMELCRVIRSKNAGPFALTFDLIFVEAQDYQVVKDRGLIHKELLAELYGIPVEEVLSLMFFDPALAVKGTIRRKLGAGDIGDTDVYGAQQHAPWLNLELEV